MENIFCDKRRKMKRRWRKQKIFELVEKMESETLTRERKTRKTKCNYSMMSIIAVLEFSFKLIVMI
jgi:hypothetical protein